ncbi:hypothetical protein GmHk_08G023117 [Glycine max]|nr:hypothetical protein GmHk_08G023117 [Glycine max]
MHLYEYLASMGQICVAPRQCTTDYMKWFYMISHPFMSPTQPRDPPTHPPVVHDDTFIEPDPPQQPVTAAAMPEPPTPAIEASHAITERLERLINMRVVTAGTEACTVTEECLRIVAVVTAQGNAYV